MIEVKKNQRLARLSSWRVGGNAEYFVEPTTIEEVKAAQRFAKEKELSITILGGGTNTLINDSGISGLVVSTRKLVGLSSTSNEKFVKIECLAGTPKLLIMKEFLKFNLSPSLFLAGIPGDIGGGVVMNAGVSEDITPREFVDITEWIEVVRDTEILHFKASDLKWEYRRSIGWEPGVVVRVGLSWKNDPQKNMKDLVLKANEIRFSKQPLDQPSCGSVFVNPPGLKSGQLIEASGLKGHAVGGAQVSEKHANFIVNTGKATAKDIAKLIEHVQRVVFEKQGVKLQNEIRFLGNW